MESNGNKRLPPTEYTLCVIPSNTTYLINCRLLLARPAESFNELHVCNADDDELFGRAMRLSNHVLHTLIPSQTSAIPAV